MQKTTLNGLAVLVLFGTLLPASLVLVNAQQRGKPKFNTWRQYLGASDSSQYSSLDQINKKNVAKLQVAWTYSTGDMRTYRFNPIVVDGVMYMLAKNMALVALDAATGKEIWTHENQGAVGDRGMNYWESADRKDRRLLFINGGLPDGHRRRDRQDDRVVRREGPGRRPPRPQSRRHRHAAAADRQPRARLREPDHHLAAGRRRATTSRNPGDTHAYDVRTGKLVWTFHSVPEKGEFGADTWPEAALATGGGVHNWSELTVDEARGIAYIPFGTARFDFYGGNRIGNNLFGNSIVALDARTGKRLWHFQAVHHDLWDYDFPQAPKLLTVRHDGQKRRHRRAGQQAGLPVRVRSRDRQTAVADRGEAGAADRRAGRSDVADAADSDAAAAVRAAVVHGEGHQSVSDGRGAGGTAGELLKNSRNEGVFTPPSMKGSVEMPGHNGGANWGSSAINPAKGTFFIVSKELPTLLGDRAAGRGDRTRRRRRRGRRAGARLDRKARRAAARRRLLRRRRHSGRAGGIRRLQLAVRLLQQLRQRHVRDRAAMVAADGVRSEHREDHVAGAARRDAGPARRQDRSRQLRAARRRHGDGRRPALRRHVIGSQGARLRSGHGQGAVVDGRSGAPSKACRRSTKSAGASTSSSASAAGAGCSRRGKAWASPRRPAPAQYMAFALPKK